MSFGFLIRSEQELEDFGNQIIKGIQQDKPHQIFHLVDEEEENEQSQSIISIDTN